MMLQFIIQGLRLYLFNRTAKVYNKSIITVSFFDLLLRRTISSTI